MSWLNKRQKTPWQHNKAQQYCCGALSDWSFSTKQRKKLSLESTQLFVKLRLNVVLEEKKWKCTQIMYFWVLFDKKTNYKNTYFPANFVFLLPKDYNLDFTCFDVFLSTYNNDICAFIFFPSGILQTYLNSTMMRTKNQNGTQPKQMASLVGMMMIGSSRKLMQS